MKLINMLKNTNKTEIPIISLIIKSIIDINIELINITNTHCIMITINQNSIISQSNIIISQTKIISLFNIINLKYKHHKYTKFHKYTMNHKCITNSINLIIKTLLKTINKQL